MHSDVFEQGLFNYLMPDLMPNGRAAKLVFRPVRYSPYEDHMFLLREKIMAPNAAAGRIYATERGWVQTPQRSLVVWKKYHTKHVFARKTLEIAVKLYIYDLLFEYIDYNSSQSLLEPNSLLHRHYLNK